MSNPDYMPSVARQMKHAMWLREILADLRLEPQPEFNSNFPGHVFMTKTENMLFNQGLSSDVVLSRYAQHVLKHHGDFTQPAIRDFKMTAWFAAMEARDKLERLDEDDIPSDQGYLLSCERRDFKPHQWVVNAVKAGYLQGLADNQYNATPIAVKSDDNDKPFADEADSFLVEAATQNGFEYADSDATVLIVHEADLVSFVRECQQHEVGKVHRDIEIANFKNQKKIDGGNADAPSEIQAVPETLGKQPIVDAILHKAMEFADVHGHAVHNDPEEKLQQHATQVKADLIALVQASINGPSDTSSALILNAVEEYYRGAELHMVRATVANLLENVDDMEANFTVDEPPTVTITLDLGRTSDVWDRVTLESSLGNDDNGRPTITYTLTKKEKNS